jgi:hypothetical protein
VPHAGHWAARAMRVDVLEERFQKVTRTLLDSRRGAHALVDAVEKLDHEVVQLLLDGGADVHAGRRNRCLFELCIDAGAAASSARSDRARAFGLLPARRIKHGEADKYRQDAPQVMGCEQVQEAAARLGVHASVQLAWAQHVGHLAQTRMAGTDWDGPSTLTLGQQLDALQAGLEVRCRLAVLDMRAGHV